MIILDISSHLAIYLVRYPALNTVVTAADVGFAALDTIDCRYHQAPGPIRAQYSIAFETAS
jgi:hypothetical protein